MVEPRLRLADDVTLGPLQHGEDDALPVLLHELPHQGIRHPNQFRPVGEVVAQPVHRRPEPVPAAHAEPFEITEFDHAVDDVKAGGRLDVDQCGHLADRPDPLRIFRHLRQNREAAFDHLNHGASRLKMFSCTVS